RIWPPARCAGPSAIQRPRSVRVNPRLLDSVHITGNATDRLDIPPHAVLKLPSSSFFIGGGHGEWSVATRSITPSISTCHSRSQFSRLRIGGAHLHSVAPLLMGSEFRCR